MYVQCVCTYLGPGLMAITTTGVKHMKSMVIVSVPRNIAQNSNAYFQNMKQGESSKFLACVKQI